MDAMKPVVENIVNDLECINSKEIKILR